MVRFSARGAEGLVHGLSVLAEIEAEVQARIGDDKMAAFREGLAAVVEVLTAPRR